MENFRQREMAERGNPFPQSRPTLWERVMPGLMVAALLLPLIFSAPEKKSFLHLGLPRVHSGDEPHYLVMLNSLLSDHDLDLRNNYEAVHMGGEDAGRYFKGLSLDNHTTWYINGKLTRWFEVYAVDEKKWGHDAQGHPVPVLKAGVVSPDPGRPEYSWHPPGVALLLAPLLYPFRGTTYVEPLAIFCSTLAMIAAMFLFRALVLHFDQRHGVANLVTAVAFLGTPAWHYGRTFFNEPYLLLFAAGAYSLVLRGRGTLLAGTMIGLGLLMKPFFILVAVPLGLMMLAEKKTRALALFALPQAACILVILWMNYWMFGSPWRVPQPFQIGSFFKGASGLLFDARHGCLNSAPALLVALVAWPAFMRAHRREALMLGGGVLLYFLFISMFHTWHGGYCYGPRYLVPVLPLLFVALVSLPASRAWREAWARWLLGAVCVLSVAVNFVAANPYWNSWDKNPLTAPWK